MDIYWMPKSFLRQKTEMLLKYYTKNNFLSLYTFAFYKEAVSLGLLIDKHVSFLPLQDLY
jgi:hypothetical protein